MYLDNFTGIDTNQYTRLGTLVCSYTGISKGEALIASPLDSRVLDARLSFPALVTCGQPEVLWLACRFASDFPRAFA